MSEVIDGFRLTVSGQELINMCMERVEHTSERIQRLQEAAERVKEMAPEDREIANLKMRNGDMADEVEAKLKQAKKDLKYYLFVAEHIENDATYRISHDTFKVFDVHSPSRY